MGKSNLSCKDQILIQSRIWSHFLRGILKTCRLWGHIKDQANEETLHKLGGNIPTTWTSLEGNSWRTCCVTECVCVSCQRMAQLGQAAGTHCPPTPLNDNNKLCPIIWIIVASCRDPYARSTGEAAACVSVRAEGGDEGTQRRELLLWWNSPQQNPVFVPQH